MAHVVVVLVPVSGRWIEVLLIVVFSARIYWLLAQERVAGFWVSGWNVGWWLEPRCRGSLVSKVGNVDEDCANITCAD